MPPVSLPSRSKLGHAYKQLRYLSPRARKALSILFGCGLLFFGFLSLSIYVNDPESVHAKNTIKSGLKPRRSLVNHVTRGHQIGPGQAVPSGSGSARNPLRLLLATHNRLFWYNVESGTSHVLHEGEGVHYGVFPGEHTNDGGLKTVWNVIRPHNWHPKTSKEFLVQFDAEKGHEVSRVRIHSRFTHDAVRRGNRVYLANTEGGEIQELQFPSMKPVRSMKLFTLKQHVNTLAPLDDGAVWAMLHNLGQSDIVKVDPGADPRPRVTETIKSVGLKAHGLVTWRPAGAAPDASPFFVVLDSEKGGLVVVDRGTGEVRRVWQVPASDGPPRFLKGLCVVDDVAYFAINVWGERKTRDSAANDAELAAVDLTSGSLLWRRRVPSHGLLNIVAAPQLGEQSTYRAMSSAGGLASQSSSSSSVSSSGSLSEGENLAATREAATVGADGDGDGGNGKHRSLVSGDSDASGSSVGGGSKATVKTGIDDPRVVAATQQLIKLGYKPKIGGHWSSGQPRLDLKIKDSTHSWDAGISLPLMQVDIDKVKERILGMPEQMWDPKWQRKENAAVDGRTDNMQKFKPGVESVYLVFSDQSTEHVYRFPYYDYFKDAVEPLLEQILGREDMNKVVRLQFARMKPGSTIKPHQDMGGYARFAHRIHLPIVSNENISFQVCPEIERRATHTGSRRMAISDMRNDCVQVPMAEGMVFELNNRVMHLVLNKGDIKRVQMVMDVSENPRTPRRLKPGTSCVYNNAVMVCPPEGLLPDS